MILWRYISKEFLKFVLYINVFFISIFLIITFLEENTRYFPKYNVPPRVIIEYFVLHIPKLFIDILPFSVMISAIVTLWIFARSGEVSAMRAAGQSVFKVCAPLIFWGTFFTALSFCIANYVVPISQLQLRKVITVKIEKKVQGEVFYDSKWVLGERGSILHFKRFDAVEKLIEDPQYFVYSSANELSEIVHASRASFDEKLGVWVLESAAVAHFSAGTGKLFTELRSRYATMVTSQPPRILAEGITADQVSYEDLKTLIVQAKKTGGGLADKEVELYQKASMPFANLLFVFLAMPFALRKERQADTYIGIVICLAVAIVYWVGNLSLRGLAQSGVLNPLVAAWVVNVLFAFGLVIWVKKLDRGQ